MPHLKGKSGIDWHYEIEGSGQTLLFIHGWGVDGRIWRQQTKYFSRGHRVITLDLPGHGQSTWVKVSLNEMAHDMELILLHLKIDEITLIGSSLGGLLGLKFYSIYPGRIKELSFVGSMPKFSKSHDFPYGLDVTQMRKLGGQLKSDYPAIVNIFFRSLFTKEERASRRFKWLQKFRQTDAAPMKDALVDYLDILEQEDLRHVLSSIKIPVQFINGFEDQICQKETVYLMKQLVPHARVNFFKDCGHFPFLSKPHEFNEVLEKFIKKQ